MCYNLNVGSVRYFGGFLIIIWWKIVYFIFIRLVLSRDRVLVILFIEDLFFIINYLVIEMVWFYWS